MQDSRVQKIAPQAQRIGLVPKSGSGLVQVLRHDTSARTLILGSEDALAKKSASFLNNVERRKSKLGMKMTSILGAERELNLRRDTGVGLRLAKAALAAAEKAEREAKGDRGGKEGKTDPTKRREWEGGGGHEEKAERRRPSRRKPPADVIYGYDGLDLKHVTVADLATLSPLHADETLVHNLVADNFRSGGRHGCVQSYEERKKLRIAREKLSGLAEKKENSLAERLQNRRSTNAYDWRNSFTSLSVPDNLIKNVDDEESGSEKVGGADADNLEPRLTLVEDADCLGKRLTFVHRDAVKKAGFIKDERYFGDAARRRFNTVFQKLSSQQIRYVPTAASFQPSFTKDAAALPSADGETQSPPPVVPLRFVDSLVGKSPRHRFLGNCIDQKLPPRAGCIIRHTNAPFIDLSHRGMGNALATVFADSLRDLPSVCVLNVADNGLTDEGVGSIIDAVRQRSDLVSLNISQNVVDGEAAEALANYLGDSSCPLTKLVLSNADVDDSEASRFVAALTDNTCLTDLDLSHNIIGIDENLNIVQPELITGGERIAEELCNPYCELKRLDLSWNLIRRDSAVEMGVAMRANTSLTELNLAYNAFGSPGGMAVGDALEDAGALRSLDISHNSIPPHAAFVIAMGINSAAVIDNDVYIDNDDESKWVDMSGNPIGEIGASQLLAQISAYVLVGRDVKIGMLACNLAIGDSAFWFNPREPTGDYTLDMNKPFERAVAKCLVGMAGRDSGCRIVSMTLDGQKVELVRKVTKVEPLTATQIKLLNEKAAKMFAEYDADGSNALDKTEIQQVLKGLGRPCSDEDVARVFAAYDTDGSGQIELAEFLAEFRENAVEKSRKRRGVSAMLAPGTNTHWKPPRQGVLKATFKSNPTDSMDTFITSREETDALLHAIRTSKSSEGAHLVELGMGELHLQAEEAMEFYRQLVKEMPTKFKALALILPHMAAPHHARVLISMNTDKDERKHLRNLLGAAYLPIIGLSSGHYRLDLSDETDRLAASRLMAIANSEASRCRHSHRKDTSQGRNWKGFRNEFFNRRRNPIDAKGEINPNRSFSSKMPSQGILEFDYVSTARPTTTQKPMSERRFQQMMQQLGLVNVRDAEYRTANPNYRSEMLAACRRYPKTSACYDEIRRLYQTDGAVLVKSNANTNTNTNSNSDRISSDVLTPLKERTTLLPPVLSRTSSHAEQTKIPPKPKQRESRTFLPGAPAPVVAAAVDIFDGRKNILLGRGRRGSRWGAALEMVCDLGTLALMQEVIVAHWITSEQAAELYTTLAPLLKTSHVEIAMTLFSRTHDIGNFSTTVMSLMPEDMQALLFYRIGWLNLFDPMHPDIHYELDLARSEERQVVKMLVHLGIDEPGENFCNESFQWSLHEDPIPGWELNASWLTEDGMPSKGILKTEYYSGEGRHLRGCRENWDLRRDLTCCTLSYGCIPENAPGKQGNGCPESLGALLKGVGIEWDYDGGDH